MRKNGKRVVSFFVILFAVLFAVQRLTFFCLNCGGKWTQVYWKAQQIRCPTCLSTKIVLVEKSNV